MRKNAVVFSLVASALLASLGTERAIAQDEHDHQHQPASIGSSEKAAKSPTGKSAATRHKAAKGEGMMGMSAEQKQQHMKRMDETCK